ncbi:MAG: ABC transporter transmembrane domain-containing protein, partial [Pseudomonadota bacterium]
MSTSHPTLTDGRHHTSAKAPVGTTGEPTAVSDEDGKESRRVRLEPLKALLPYLIENKLILVAGGLALLVSAGMMLALPVAVRRIVDHGFSPESRDLINSYFSVLMVMGLVLAVASSARAYCVNWLGENVVARIRSDVFSHLTTLGPAFFASTHSGELMSRLTADTTQVKSAAGNAISQALRNSIMLIGALIMMFVTSAQLSVVLLVAIPAIVFPLLAYGRIVRHLSRRAQDTLAKSSAYAAENLAAVSTLQAYTNERHVSDRFREEVRHALTAATDRLRARAGLTTVAIALITISVVGVLWYGSSLVIAGDMSAGRLSQFVLYAVFAAGALAELAEVMGEVQQAAGAAERLSELLAVVPPIAPVANPKPLPDQLTDGVRFENVSFAYPGRPDTNALDEITLHAPAGRMVALVGPSGAGKSTALNLLLRFYDPGAGRITIDGISIRDVDLTDLRKRLALVSQDVALFADTVSENIRYGSPDATDAEVVAAAKAAQADRFIRELSNGYDTVVGERGVTLSGGQRQRIAIARAILRDAPIL